VRRRYGKSTGRTWDRPERYALLPLDVLQSEAVRTLPHYAYPVLLALAVQFNGRNNGDLCATLGTLRPFGVTSNEQLVKSLRELLRRGLVIKTRQGGKRPLGCSLYGVGWVRIHESEKYDVGVGATIKPVNGWARWTAARQNDRTAGSPISGRPADQREPLTGRPADQTGASFGTAGSPPSISGGGGSRLSVVHHRGAA
jgi:hypothetical protein